MVSSLLFLFSWCASYFLKQVLQLHSWFKNMGSKIRRYKVTWENGSPWQYAYSMLNVCQWSPNADQTKHFLSFYFSITILWSEEITLPLNMNLISCVQSITVVKESEDLTISVINSTLLWWKNQHQVSHKNHSIMLIQFKPLLDKILTITTKKDKVTTGMKKKMQHEQFLINCFYLKSL